jgi:hypothetical protein
VRAYLKSRAREADLQREIVEARRLNVPRNELLQRKQADAATGQ